MHEPHSSVVRRITHFVRVEVVMPTFKSCYAILVSKNSATSAISGKLTYDF